MTLYIEILIISIITSISCSLAGVFLVLRKMSMITDCITHTIILGIVLAFFITKDLSSPFLILGATLMGVFTVFLCETLIKTNLVSEDASIGIVFPFLFSLAIILIAKYANSTHLDTDAVFLGELAFAPFDRLIINGVDFGAKLIYTSSLILIANIIFMLSFYKVLKISTFDLTFAKLLGFSPLLIHYSLMTITSLTVVGSFEAVGGILVIAFMVIPVNTAFLLTHKLHKLIIISTFFAIISAILGFIISIIFDVSIAGCMSVVSGLIFLSVFVCSSNKYIIKSNFNKKLKKSDFEQF